MTLEDRKEIRKIESHSDSILLLQEKVSEPFVLIYYVQVKFYEH